jgi:hypothetical protein
MAADEARRSNLPDPSKRHDAFQRNLNIPRISPFYISDKNPPDIANFPSDATALHATITPLRHDVTFPQTSGDDRP